MKKFLNICFIVASLNAMQNYKNLISLAAGQPPTKIISTTPTVDAGRWPNAINPAKVPIPHMTQSYAYNANPLNMQATQDPCFESCPQLRNIKKRLHHSPQEYNDALNEYTLCCRKINRAKAPNMTPRPNI
jgi:hypothetical protein